MRRADFVVRWILTLVFLAAAVPKVGDPGRFAQAIARYRLLPDAAISPAAILIPWFEIVAAVALAFVPRLREAGAVLLTALLAVFTLALVVTELRGLDIECGCFSLEPSAPTAFGWLLARDLGLLGLAGWCAWRHGKSP